jgi:hypothetical protein
VSDTRRIVARRGREFERESLGALPESGSSRGECALPTVSSPPIVCHVPALRATQREELLIVTRPCCQVGVETLRQLPCLTAHVVHLADEFRILLEYEIGHGWSSYASEMACESSGVLDRRIPDVEDTQQSEPNRTRLY